jgi:ACR3 family arsenite efflux pump ArsB
LSKIQEPEKVTTTAEELPAPGGIGMAVAIDWGLAVQMLFTPILAIFRPSNPMIPAGFNRPPGNVLFFVIAVVFACICVLFGEMLRRGRNWARWIQIIFNALLSLAGLFSLYGLYRSITAGNFWPLVTEIILVIISPLIVWRLTRPSTARWFKGVTVAEASKRHGGRWIWFIALFAIIGGVLQTLAAMSR